MTQKPSANAPSTTTHPEEVAEISLIFSKYELFVLGSCFFSAAYLGPVQIKQKYRDVFKLFISITGERLSHGSASASPHIYPFSK